VSRLGYLKTRKSLSPTPCQGIQQKRPDNQHSAPRATINHRNRRAGNANQHQQQQQAPTSASTTPKLPAPTIQPTSPTTSDEKQSPPYINAKYPAATHNHRLPLGATITIRQAHDRLSNSYSQPYCISQYTNTKAQTTNASVHTASTNTNSNFNYPTSNRNQTSKLTNFIS
jgi:hypothetical protein